VYRVMHGKVGNVVLTDAAMMVRLLAAVVSVLELLFLRVLHGLG
jgi:hypothetical protein